MFTQRRCTAIAFAAAGLLLGLCAAQASAESASPPAQATLEGAKPAPEAPPAPTPSPTTAAAPNTAPSAPPSEAKPSTEPNAGARKPLTPEQIEQLPVFHRFDMPTEKVENLLGDVKDDTFGYDEPAFYALAAQVAKLPPKLFKPEAECLPYARLLAQPSSYRGQPVTICGVYMMAAPFTTPVLALQKDIPMMYECTLRELPVEQAKPIATVITLEDPMLDFTVGDMVRVKGYFYKVRRYEGTKGESSAPMLIAQRLESDAGFGITTQPTPRGSMAGGLQFGLAIGLLVLLLGGFFVIRQMIRGKHAASERPIHKFRLRRDDRPAPDSDRGPGSEGGGTQP
jgi:hypothetical protein